MALDIPHGGRRTGRGGAGDRRSLRRSQRLFILPEISRGFGGSARRPVVPAQRAGETGPRIAPEYHFSNLQIRFLRQTSPGIATIATFAPPPARRAEPRPTGPDRRACRPRSGCSGPAARRRACARRRRAQQLVQHAPGAKAPSPPQSMATKLVAEGRACSPLSRGDLGDPVARDRDGGLHLGELVRVVPAPPARRPGSIRAMPKWLRTLSKARDQRRRADGIAHARAGHAVGLGEGAHPDHPRIVRRRSAARCRAGANST